MEERDFPRLPVRAGEVGSAGRQVRGSRLRVAEEPVNVREQLQGMRLVVVGSDDRPEMHRGVRGMQHLLALGRRARRRFRQAPGPVVRLCRQASLPERGFVRRWACLRHEGLGYVSRVRRHDARVPRPMVTNSMRLGSLTFAVCQMPLGTTTAARRRERHFAKAARLFQQQHCRARQQVDELVGFGMHFPVRPVRGALELGDEPAAAEAIELGLGQGPEPLTAGNRLGRSGRGEMDIGFSGIERHGQLPFGRTGFGHARPRWRP